MSGRQGSAFHELEIYQRYEVLSQALWDAVDAWGRRHQEIIGTQMLRAVDSIGANIAEAVGRGHFRESLHHLMYARGSLTETQHWIRVAIRRSLLGAGAVEKLRETSVVLHKQLNAFIRAQSPMAEAAASVGNADRVQDLAADYSEGVADFTTDGIKEVQLAGQGQCVMGERQASAAGSQEPRAKSQEPGASHG